MFTLFAVALGGATGAVARYLTGLACRSLLGDAFGYGTLLVNVVGCFLLGLLAHSADSNALRLPWLSHPGVTAGLLGGLTTFSTFGYETVAHIQNSEWKLAALNVLANVLLGCLAAAGGLGVSQWFAAP